MPICYACPLPQMPTVSNATFGPLVAYLVPGSTVLAALSPFSATLRGWLAVSPPGAPTIGGFLSLTVAALAVGMTVSAIRWAVVDALHARTGLPPPQLDFSRLGPNVEAFALLIDIHYKHYLFYSNMLVACAAAYICYRTWLGSALPPGWPDALFAALEAVFYLTSRDTLAKYHTRTRQLLSVPQPSNRPVTSRRRSRARGGRRSPRD